MADFNFGFSDFADDDDTTDEYAVNIGARDGLIFLIDSSKSMFDVDGDSDNESSFSICLNCAKTTLQNKIISSDKDLIAIVFFATETSNTDFKNIYLYQDLDQPDARRILQIEDLLQCNLKSFEKEYGHSTAFSLSDAFWACSNIFSKCSHKFGSKRIILLTDNDDPHSDNSQLQRQAITKASDLEGNGIDLEVLPLSTSGGIKFNMQKFYKDLITLADDETLPDPSDRLEDLLTRVRSKDYKKHAQVHLSFFVTDGLKMAVGVYNLIRPSTKPYPVKLNKRTNEELKTRSTCFVMDTSEMLGPDELKKCQTYGGRRICFENDEVNELKHFGQSGLFLLGFKPQCKLKPYFHIKCSQFLFPDEKVISGSTTLFSALLRKCHDRGVVPICLYIARRNSPPRYAMLLPQMEEIDEDNVQVSPPGFHVIFLPFADDFRKIPIHDTAKATCQQIDKAKEIVKKLQFNYSVENFENPVLQQYWRNVEALALDRDEPELCEDYTKPKEDTIEKCCGTVISEFKDLVFPEDYCQGKKRKGDIDASGGVKKVKPGDLDELDMKTEAENGRLGKITVVALKDFIKQKKIKCSGSKKADLINAINDFYDV